MSLSACLKEPEGGRTGPTGEHEDTGDHWEDNDDGWEDNDDDWEDTDDGWEDTDDGWEDTGEPGDGFPHGGEYDECDSVQIILSGGGFGEFPFCNEGSASFTIVPNGVLTGQAFCTSDLTGQTISLAFTGEVTRSGAVQGQVAIQHTGFSDETFEMVGEVRGDEVKVSWQGEIPSAGRTGLPFDELEGEAWASTSC